MKLRPLPKSIMLPGLSRVPIKLVTAKSLENEFCAEERLNVEFYAAAFVYRNGKPTILINKSQSIKSQWKVLYHEIKHYLIDVYDDMLSEELKPWQST